MEKEELKRQLKDFKRQLDVEKKKIATKIKEIARLSEGDGGTSVNLLMSATSLMDRLNESIVVITTTVPCKQTVEAQKRLSLESVRMLDAMADGMIEMIKSKREGGK